MDDKRRSKRARVSNESEGFWDCSVCTYRNTPEAFKCDMCDVRKGTSTRKPQLNAQLVAQQVATQHFALPPVKKDKPHKKTPTSATTSPQAQGVGGTASAGSAGKKAAAKPAKESKASTPASTPTSSKPKRPVRLKNVDRSTAFSMEVTVNDVTVIFTDYKPKKEKKAADKDASAVTSGATSGFSSPTLSPSQSVTSSVSPSPSVTSSALSPVTSQGDAPVGTGALPQSSDSPRSGSLHQYSVDNLLNVSNTSTSSGSSNATEVGGKHPDGGDAKESGAV